MGTVLVIGAVTVLTCGVGFFAGPMGLVIGAIAGTAVGWLIDEFGDAIIDWVVGLFD